MPDTAPSPSLPGPATPREARCPAPGAPEDPLAGLRQRAESGNAWAQLELADRLHFGEGAPQDDEGAWLWMRRAAEQGLAEAQSKAGYFLLHGLGVPRDPAAAVTWLRKGARGGFAPAAYNLGMCFDCGDGVPVRPVRARVWLKRAVELGHTEARVELARLLLDGVGGPVDAPAAIALLRAGAEAGSIAAIRALATAAVRDLAGPEDLELAERLLVEAHEKGRPDALEALFHVWRMRSEPPPLPERAVEAMQELDRLLQAGGDASEPSFEELMAEPVPVVRRRAAAGSSRAASELGFRYFRGDGLPQSFTRGVRWLRRAAEKGEIAACGLLGDVLCVGDTPGVPPNVPEGLRFLRCSAAGGSPRGQYHLAVCLLAEGEHHDPAEAAWWLRLAAPRVPAAAEELAWLYFDGKGVPLDYEGSYGWLALAGEEASPRGCFHLGYALAFGGGSTPCDPARAFQLVRSAADRGYVAAMALVGSMYDDGLGVDRDGAEAVRWLRAAAEEGSSGAAYGLASILFDGRGVPPDPEAAVPWLEGATGSEQAPHLLSLMLFRGEGTPRDVARARSVFLRAVGKRHLPSLFTTLEEEAARYRPAATRSRDQREAVLATAAAGEAGDARAALEAGLVLWNADCGITEDQDRAVRLLRTAAEAGDPLAQACLWEATRWSFEDPEVLRWLVRAADAGLPGAQRELARVLIEDPDRPGVIEEAARRLEAAAEAGDALACADVARYLTAVGDGETERVRELLRYARESGIPEPEVE